MFSFPQSVLLAQQELQDAVQAVSRPSGFAQGVAPAMGGQPQPPMGMAPQQMQMGMMSQQPQMGVMPPQMQQPMVAPPMQPQQPMAQPPTPVQQFAKGGLAVWDKPAPEGKSKPLSAKKKATAKCRAKAAGRPYPNAVDNFAVARKKR